MIILIPFHTHFVALIGISCTVITMAWRVDGQIQIPAKLVPSPLCAPARFAGKRFANPARKQRRWPQDAYPLHHPLRQEALETVEMERTAARMTERQGTSNFYAETEMVNLDSSIFGGDIHLKL